MGMMVVVGGICGEVEGVKLLRGIYSDGGQL